MCKNYGLVTVQDLTKIEGHYPHNQIEVALREMSTVTPNWAFVSYIKKELGFDEAHPPSDQKQVAVYNLIGTALNQLGESATPKSLCNLLNIAHWSFLQNSKSKWFQRGTSHLWVRFS
jgi:hypothetical protein